MQAAKLPPPYRQRPLRKKETVYGKLSSKYVGELGKMSFALSSMQGWRITQEDAHTHVLPTRGRKDVAFFGVFDGHGGNKASTYAAKNVLSFIEGSQTYKFLEANKPPDAQVLARSLLEGYFDCDEAMRKQAIFANGDTSGSTAVSCLVTPDTFIIGNTGDSRLVLCRNSQVQFASKDHKPNDPVEVQRIQAAGGYLKYGRINGDLASARSFGDFRYKKDPGLPASQQQVTVMPDIVMIDRDRNYDQVLVLACDGIWDVMTNLECTQFALAALRLGASLTEAAEMILDECLRKSSGDNMSVLLVALDNVPKEMGKRKGQVTLDEVRRAMYETVL